MFGAPLQSFGRFNQLQQIQTWPTPMLFVRPLGGAPASTVVLQSTDGFWYPITAILLAPDSATLAVDDTPVSPSIRPYLVIANITDGLNYRFGLDTTDGIVAIAVAQNPTAEPITGTFFAASGEIFQLKLETDGDVTWTLIPV